jgi:PAS domain S-box-containing protein
LRSVPWGTHFSHFYETRDDLLDVVIPYFEAGLGAGEAGLWITCAPLDPSRALIELKRRLPDAERYLESGAMEVVSADEWYFIDGQFDPDHALRAMLAKIQSALDRGFVGMRGHGNEEWLKHEDWDRFAEYEAELDKALIGRPAVVLCSYPLRTAKAADVLDVARTHDFVVARRKGEWEILETSESVGAKTALERLNSRLENLVNERTAKLEEARAELERSNALYRFMTETINEIISVYDTEGQRIYISPSAERILGYVPDDKFTAMHEDDRPRAAEFWAQLLEGNAASMRFRMRHADGSWRWLDCDAWPGEFDGTRTIIGVARDVTGRVEIEELYSFVADNINEILALFEADGKRTFISKSAIRVLGHVPAEDFSGVHPNDLDRVNDGFARVIAGETVSVTFRHRHSDGSWRWLEFTGKPADFDGKRHLIAVGRDVTERVRLEDQLNHAQRMEALGRLAGGVAHDFNNLLTAIYGFGELVATDIPPDSAAHENVREMQRAIDRAQGVTRQLLTFSRREALEPQTVDLGVAISRMERMLRLLLREDIRLDVRVIEKSLPVLIDPAQLEQLLVNLVSNAGDATTAGGKIEVICDCVREDAQEADGLEVIPPGDYVRLRVIDTGLGMVPEIAAKAFDPFFTTKPPGVGTGLGLSTVFGIVRQAGGHIRLDSEPGAGTSVKVLLPPASTTVEARKRRPAGPISELSGKTVLVVEDEDLVRALIEQILSRHGAEVIVAAHPADAAEILSNPQERVDLLLSDVIMPGMSGPSLVVFARKLRPNMPVVLISGYTADEQVMSSVGPDCPLVEKPFRPEELLRVISQALKPRAGSRKGARTKRKR